MAYATQQDIVDLEGEDALYAAADREGNGVLDTAAIARALDNATGEMNSYIGQRHELPLTVTPPWSMQICIDITMYRLCRGADRLSNSIVKRYEDAIAFLKDVAAGRAGLGVAVTAAPVSSVIAGDTKGGEILVTSNDRLFRRNGRRCL